MGVSIAADTLLMRRLEPFLANVDERLVQSPKVYIRDSGLVHALLNITSLSGLQGHTIVGASWEGFVVEQVRAHLPVGAEMGSHHTAVGAELDIVVQTGRPRLGIEVKFWSASTVTKGFWQAVGDLKLDRPVVVAPVERRYPLKQGVELVPVWNLPAMLAQLGQPMCCNEQTQSTGPENSPERPWPVAALRAMLRHHEPFTDALTVDRI